MKTKGTIVIIFICSIFLAACQPTQLPPEPKELDEWVYRYFNYDEVGNVVDSTDINFEAHSVTWATPSQTEPYAEIVQVPFENFHSPIRIPNGTFRMNAEGLYYLSADASATYPCLFLKYPGTIGEVFKLRSASNIYIEDRIITSTNATVTVPFGTVTNLYTYKFEKDGSPKGNLWFNDSLWFVKYESIDSLPSGTGVYVDFSYELVNYTPH